MKITRLFNILMIGYLAAGVSFAQVIEPVISKNVHVLKNVTPSQCPASWRGTADPADVITDGSTGVSNSEIAAGVLSCSDCSFDQSSSDCVCKTCYGDYN